MDGKIVYLIERALPSQPRSAAQARQALEAMRDELSAQQFEDLQLLVSELVSNVLKHGRLESEQRLCVRVALDDRQVRVEVSQPGPAFRAPEMQPAGLQESGWGLRMLDLLASRWGLRSHPTTVWFEIHRDPGRASRTQS